jgi:ATP-dependent RNA helicase DDX24/MAK5
LFAASRLPQWNELGLKSELLRAIDELQFRQPTPIQREAIPKAIRDRKDIVGAAETVIMHTVQFQSSLNVFFNLKQGSGKTLAFGLPMLQLLMEENENSNQEKNWLCK